MAIVRRAAAPAPKVAPAPKQSGGSVDFGSPSFYTGGLGLAEGDYALEFNVQMFQPTKLDGTPARTQAFLAVMITAYPLNGGEPSSHPLGCGPNSHKSFVPSEDGKGFDPVAGGGSTGINKLTNWSIFLQSMWDNGLPMDLLHNDLSVLDGIHVHTRNIPEPEERKGMRASTGMAALEGEEAQDPNRTRLIPVVTEIKEDGKPWEGTGGIPAEGAAPVAKPAATLRRAAPAVAAPRRPVAVAAPVEEPAEAASDEDIQVAAVNGISEHLGKAANAKGCTKLALRTGTFAAVSKAQGEDMANAVLETYFGSDDALNVVLNELGYVSAGGQVKVA